MNYSSNYLKIDQRKNLSIFQIITKHLKNQTLSLFFGGSLRILSIFFKPTIILSLVLLKFSYYWSRCLFDSKTLYFFDKIMMNQCSIRLNLSYFKDGTILPSVHEFIMMKKYGK